MATMMVTQPAQTDRDGHDLGPEGGPAEPVENCGGEEGDGVACHCHAEVYEEPSREDC
jgi:hypothetical protein